MSSDTIDMLSKGLWDRAKTICISMIQSDSERNHAERNFSMITSVASEGDVFIIYTANSLAADMLQKDYGDSLRKCFELAGAEASLRLEFKADATAKMKIIIPTKDTIVEKAPNGKISTFVSTMPLKEYYTFEEFVEGPSNSYVLAAAKGVANNPGQKALNPLFIHGGTGLGKTHVMQAIGNFVKKNNPTAAVCYLTAEVFINEYVNALTANNLKAFRDRYRKIDVLLIDDIQFIAKNMKNFQEEFFNTFNALTNADKQIVITSDVAPKNLPGIEERLISRFEGGMLQEIESPAYETRLAILKKKAECMVPPVSETTLSFIAQNVKSHVRAMEGALSKVNMFQSRQPSVIISNEILAYILKDIIETEKARRNLTIEEVQNCVAKKYSVSLSQILSEERTQSLVTPRQLSMYIAKKFTTKSLKEIGAAFDKSHATIIHGVKTITKRLDVEPELVKSLKEIISELGCSMEDMIVN